MIGFILRYTAWGLFGAGAGVIAGGGSLLVAAAILMVAALARCAPAGYSRLKRKRALQGAYGEEVRWMMEIMHEEQDEEFIRAMSSLEQMDVTEIIIIAESKDDVRRLVFERASES